ncbi:MULTISPECIES: methyltransferase [unclassified Granulicatella]|uniref:methyltransferase n=1 Tax=unclassified Granulicatella TaxID=2630493 RepID=UPI00143194B6|nr:MULTISPECIES: methyltransferase [unclassified Granulicatella]MBF0779742.1 methyltransferase domain-containing protein [Granulicatella sp. 19428wC4_WM01]
MPIYDCQRCGFIYNSFVGDAKNGVPEKMSLSQLKGTLCYDCGMAACNRKRRETKAYSGLEVEAYPYLCGQTSSFVYTNECQGKRVLDVGAGTGKIGQSFAENGASVTFLEKSDDMVKCLEYVSQRFENSTIEQKDILDAQLSDFDIIVAGDGLLQHVQTFQEQRNVFEKLAYALNLNGELFIELFIPKGMTMQSKRVKEAYEGTYYFMDVIAELDLLSKEIRTEIAIEKVVDNKVLEKARFERLLSLILLKDIEQMIEMLNEKSDGIEYVLSACQQFDSPSTSDYFKVKSYSQHRMITHEWIHTGYPFSMTDTQQVSWWRLCITKKKRIQHKRTCCAMKHAKTCETHKSCS